MINSSVKFFKERGIIKDVKIFNKNLFKDNKIFSNSIILTEFTTNKSMQASFALFLKNIQKKNGCKIVSYDSNINYRKKNFLEKFLDLKKFINHNYKIYSSFNVNDIIRVEYDKKIETIAQREYPYLFKEITSKKKLLKLQINNIWVGDLIYDSYLKESLKPTIDLSSSDFREYFIKFIYAFYYWLNFFKMNKVSCVIGSHSVYTTAIPMRIALKKDIPVYQVNINNIYKLSKKKLFAYDLFSDYSKLFNKFDKQYKIKAIKYAKERCTKRFKGFKGVDMHYSNKSAYKTNLKNTRVLSLNSKKKILIAAHCFLDNPHPYGIKCIFNDFYEWVNFLGEYSKTTNFDWYIKTHPDFRKETQAQIVKFIKKYPHIKLIPADTSHHQLIKEGINCALTVHGTISWEYAYLKIPVICAASNTPHVSFNFSYHAKNKNDLKKAITNFRKLNLNYSKQEIYKFYFMHNIHVNSNWMFENYEKFLKEIKGYKNIGNLIFYDYWMKYISLKKTDEIEKKINNFLKLKKFLIIREI